MSLTQLLSPAALSAFSTTVSAFVGASLGVTLAPWSVFVIRAANGTASQPCTLASVRPLLFCPFFPPCLLLFSSLHFLLVSSLPLFSQGGAPVPSSLLVEYCVALDLNGLSSHNAPTIGAVNTLMTATAANADDSLLFALSPYSPSLCSAAYVNQVTCCVTLCFLIRSLLLYLRSCTMLLTLYPLHILGVEC